MFIIGIIVGLIGAAIGIVGGLLGGLFGLLGGMLGALGPFLPIALIVAGVIWLVKSSTAGNPAPVSAAPGNAPPQNPSSTR